MHQVKVSYELSDKNNDIVKRHASIVKNGEKEVGFAEMGKYWWCRCWFS